MSTKRNIAVWITQGLLAALFGAVGLMKLSTRIDDLVLQLPWVSTVPVILVRAIGAVEVAGAVGILAPRALRILPVLTPVAAGGFTLIMTVAAVLHAVRGEWAMLGPNLAIGSASAWIALECTREMRLAVREQPDSGPR